MCWGFVLLWDTAQHADFTHKRQHIMNQKELRELIEIISDNRIAEFEMERAGFKLRIRTAYGQTAVVAVPSHSIEAPGPTPAVIAHPPVVAAPPPPAPSNARGGSCAARRRDATPFPRPNGRSSAAGPAP